MSKQTPLSPSTSKKPWADHPFPLITTPGSTNPKPWDPYVQAATEMALFHNGVIRHLNSIYLQAPHISSSEYRDFIGYSLAWYTVLHHHHEGEEEIFFPLIEEALGKKGIMDVNITQHKEFHDGMEVYRAYLAGLLESNDVSKFSAVRLREIIDSFAEVLTQHLHDEIPTLVGLSTLVPEGQPPLDLITMTQKLAQRGVGAMDKTTAVMSFWHNHDDGFEDGLHRGQFPDLPIIVGWLARGVWFWPNRRWWKWGSCDKHFGRKELGGLPEGVEAEVK